MSGKSWRSDKKRRTRSQVEAFIRLLKTEMPAGYQWVIGGSWRRGAPDIGDLDVGVIIPSGSFEDFPFPPSYHIEQGGDRKVMGDLILDDGESIHLDFWAVLPEEKGAFLLYITGPVNFNVTMRYHALKVGWTLNEKGLFDRDGRRLDKGTEESIFEKLYPFQPDKWLTPAERQQFATIAPPDADTVREWAEASDSPGKEPYLVKCTGTGPNATWTCNCHDFAYRCRRLGKDCKHITRRKTKLSEEEHVREANGVA